MDLAGSERVSKTRVVGTVLSEAKHINLSLHFLEQVIVSLQVSTTARESKSPPIAPVTPAIRAQKYPLFLCCPFVLLLPTCPFTESGCASTQVARLAT